MKKLLGILAILVCPFFLISCATIVSGREQKFPITTEPTGAKVIHNGVTYTSPCTLILDRTEPMQEITIELEGYEPQTIVLKRGVNVWICGNIVFGGIIGIVIDVCTGSVYQFYPSQAHRELSKTEVVVFIE